jgi:hypothetical protein
MEHNYQCITKPDDVIQNYSCHWNEYSNGAGEVIIDSAIQKLSEEGVIKDNIDILDIGCGYGSFIL